VNDPDTLNPQEAHEDTPTRTHVPDAPHVPPCGANSRRGAANTHSVILRAIVLGWCLWLLGAWAVSLSIDSPVPATRWMIFCSLIGLTAVWPTVRLSLDGSADGAVTWAILEWLALIAIFQIVIWPLALTARWPYLQMLWLDLAVVAWSLLTALLVVVGLRSLNGLHRLVAVVLCLLLFLAEPLIVALADVPLGSQNGPAWVMRVSPIQTVWALTENPLDWSSGPWRRNIVTVAVAVVVAWCLYGLLAGRPSRR